MDRDDARQKVIIALDVDAVEKAHHLWQLLSCRVWGFKVGFEFLFSLLGKLMSQPNNEAESLFWKARTMFEYLEGEMFADVKLKDIRTTVMGGSRGICQLSPFMFNIHATGGEDMMKGARAAVDEMFTDQPDQKPLLIAVTLLTSLNERDLRKIGYGAGVAEDVEIRPAIVRQLAVLAQECGCDGVVASPKEISLIRGACGPEFGIYTPGVRLPGSAAGDQKNVLTPGEAIRLGATGVVVGSEVTKADDPVFMVERVIDNIVAPAAATA